MLRSWLLTLLVSFAVGSDGRDLLHGPSTVLLTPWSEEATQGIPLPEYPRPQMVRDNWECLNGEWQCDVVDQGDAFVDRTDRMALPATLNGSILVPFPVESVLSGRAERVSPDQAVWYRRAFDAPKQGASGRVLLHFGAVDWRATVWVNGKKVGSHEGGFDPFTIDITDQLKPSGPQDLVVHVTDPTNSGPQPRGKQSLEPGGILYSAVTGIWQTVWMEVVPSTHITSLKLCSDVERGEIEITVNVSGDPQRSGVEAVVPIGDGRTVAGSGKANMPFRIRIPNAQLWSPDNPHLYDLKVTLVERREDSSPTIDQVTSYFGLRQIEMKQDERGAHRLFLNGEPLFHLGVLDQGWWPDGLYTAPTDEALKHDIETAKRCGFNMCRKHVKVEPDRWYYWCDKLGMMVWQDMPSGDRNINWNEPDLVRTAESEAAFRRELRAMIDALHGHPSVVVWVPFNEGWGQFDTNEVIDWIKRYDPTRLVDGPSGWADRSGGDMLDMHHYPGVAMLPSDGKRASVLGEFGGLGLPVEGHQWSPDSAWGYQTFEDSEEFTEAYRQLANNLWALTRKGLAAAVYTQIADVEGEINGLMTYDRKVLKLRPEAIAALNRRLYGPPPRVTSVVASSSNPNARGESWRYTLAPPAQEWSQEKFDDSNWHLGRAGFGTPDTPNAVVRTEWRTDDIWLRRTVTFQEDDLTQDLYLMIHHDEDTQVYVNGMLVADLAGNTSGYSIMSLNSDASKAIRAGDNLLAVHCHQVSGGQFIDIGFVAIHPREATMDVVRQAAK